MLACNKGKKHDFQVMQNDILRLCDNKKLEDRVSLEILHKKANLVSLEQHRAKQVLSLMYKLSKYGENQAVALRNTRRYEKYVFRLDNKIGTKYSMSPYNKGTILWDKLSKDNQDLENIFLFKKEIDKLYKTFDNNLIV